MRIHHVILPAADPAAAERWYREVLGLPPDAEGGVRVGGTRLAFAEGEGTASQHLAWTIPSGSLAAARAWLEPRSALLPGEHGDEIEGPPCWESRSIYFEGPDAQVLELIERRELPGVQAAGAFDATSLVSVSEVGIAVDDVLGAVDALAEAGVHPYCGSISPGFSAVGDVHGLLILVGPDRPWAPTRDRRSTSAAATVAADVPRAVRLGTGALVPVGR